MRKWLGEGSSRGCSLSGTVEKESVEWMGLGLGALSDFVLVDVTMGKLDGDKRELT